MTSDVQKDCLRIAEEVETMIIYRAETGIFLDAENNPTEAEKPLLTDVAEARELCEKGNTSQARQKLAEVYVVLQNLVAAKGARWRFYNISAGFAYFYYGALLAIFIVATVLHEPYLSAAYIGVIPFEAGLYGMLGGILRGFWWLHKKVEEKAFRRQFLMPFVAGPWLALLLGMFAWALLQAGLIVVGDGPNETAIDAPGSIALIILAGFSWEWVIAKLDPLIKGN